MQFRNIISSITAVTMLGTAAIAEAQTTAGAGTLLVLPNAAAILNAYQSDITVFNPNTGPTDPASITVAVTFFQASDPANGIGGGAVFNCNPLPVGKGRAARFDLATQCQITNGDFFGMVLLQDATQSAPKYPFTAYSRTQLANGVGYSVETFPWGNFSGALANSIGLKSTANGAYKTNCFVGTLAESVSYQIQFFDGNNNTVAAPRSGTLAPFQMIRLFNVLSGDLSNIRAEFSETSGTNPAFIGYCTVETSVGGSGSADFRIAKSVDALDQRQQRLTCFGQFDCNTGNLTGEAAIAAAAQRNVHYTIIDQPDVISCNLVAAAGDLPKLKLRLRLPGSPTGTSGYVTADNVQSFSYQAPARSQIASGFTTRWYLDVQMINPAQFTGTINYGITCRSGNGLVVPWIGAVT